MSSLCTPILVGVDSPVSKIFLLSKTTKFPFRPMDYSPWSSKNLINRNRPKKFIQVGVDVTYMLTNFDVRELFGFGDIATFKSSQIPFQPMDYSPWSSKILINRNRLKKFMQVGIDVKFMHTNFGERDLSGFRDIAFQNDLVNILIISLCLFF